MDIKRLVKRCQTGDSEAYGNLYQTYLPPMREVVAYYIHNSDVVQDILHDGFLIAFAQIGSLKDSSKIEAWLTTIMKNLSIQYLKNESNHISVPLSDAAIADNVTRSDKPRELTWEELDLIISRLPDGYGKVFRLAVLDGLSHKEIGALLGIAPHSSSSQLAHAKAMLRHMITQYRMEMGFLLIMTVILLVWHGTSKHDEATSPTPTISRNTDKKTPAVTDLTTDSNTKTDSIVPNSKERHKTKPNPLIQEGIAEVSIPKIVYKGGGDDSIADDTTRTNPQYYIYKKQVALQDLPHTPRTEISDWSLALAYSGSLGQNDMNRYRIPDPNMPDTEGPSDEIEVTEKARHHIPLVIGLTLNKSLSSRWSIETGMRYTFLRSDFLTESERMNKETVQRIHYVGIPFKLNCHLLTHDGFSLYGQGGCALDIPVNGSQSVLEYSPELTNPKTDMLHIYAPLQWSVEGGVGVQYHFRPSFSIYAEPSFHYYFNSGFRTIRQENPFEFTIPIGLRLAW